MAARPRAKVLAAEPGLPLLVAAEFLTDDSVSHAELRSTRMTTSISLISPRAFKFLIAILNSSAVGKLRYTKNGRPTGLSIANDGTIIVPDTHYYQVLFYSPDGKLLDKIGGKQGIEAGEFHFLTDGVQDSDGNYFFSEYGDLDRIHKYDANKKFVTMWGGHGDEFGEFRRPQSVVLDKNQQLWVADACNHRIQIFDRDGKFVRSWGEKGAEPGSSITLTESRLTREWNFYVCEWGNHRIQKFDSQGKPLSWWGEGGHGPQQFYNPWGL